ncbi:mediator of RNA polymerase II transcription subunit 22-like [Ornithodoros turicata]|uniref:Mediator of RNA polymerase II transcription subunit 22 n=1 Tax=Ornithodoros turicata TaxID=34597 RepID=A0A2R5LI53_9ACAR
MAQQKGLTQSKEALLKSYNKRLKDDIKSMVDNFSEMIKSTRVPLEEEGQVLRPLQVTEDQYEMHVRAANIVRAGESLMKLISDIKQYLILNDFPFINDSIAQNSQRYCAVQMDCDQRLMALRDDMAAELYELEEEYYSSCYK